MTMERNRRFRRWAVPTFCVVIGGVYLVAAWAGGDPGLGLAMMAIMAAYAAVLVVGGRVEIIRVLRGQPSDEMWRHHNARAVSFSAYVLAFSLIGLVVYEISRGGDGQPYALLCLVGAVSYVSALVWFRASP